MRDYIYSKAQGILHKSDCIYAGRIAQKNKYSTTNMFLIRKKNYSFCKYCGLEAVARNYVDVKEEEIKECLKFFKDNEIDAEFLLKYFRYYHGTMRFSHKVLYMHFREDQWILDAGHGEIVLLHNNYFYNQSTMQRQFTGGFHIQIVNGESVLDAINVAAKYKFTPYIHQKKWSTQMAVAY